MRNLVVTLCNTAPLIHSDSTAGGLLKRAKYFLCGLLFACDTKEWFEFLDTPEMESIVKNYPCLFHKLQRPYLNHMFQTAQRLEALKEHYRFVQEQISAAMIEDIYSEHGKVLAELFLEDTGPLELRLGYSHMQKEGELMLSLAARQSNKRIATLSFSVYRYQMFQKELFIGGLQGDRTTGKDVVISVTRGLYGLRPKALLVYVLQELAGLWGIHHICAVSDDLHIYRHFQRRRKVAASYDTFWSDSGGVQTPEGFFRLPATFVPRDLATIRPNKRQMYRRRYAMQRHIADEIAARMSTADHSFDDKGSPRPAVNA